MSFMMIDVDFFKAYNDTFGHDEGDKALRLVGHCLKESLRGADVAARFGGEEFAAFLLDAELAQGLVAAERIRLEIEKHAFSLIKRGKPSGTHSITISIGVASFPDDSSDPIELVEMADSALYRAKREGRNMVCAYRNVSPTDAEKPLPRRKE